MPLMRESEYRAGVLGISDSGAIRRGNGVCVFSLVSRVRGNDGGRDLPLAPCRIATVRRGLCDGFWRLCGIGVRL